MLAAALGFGNSNNIEAQEPAAGGNDDIEEVIVTARRVEGSVRRRQTAATREDLEKTDQTSMEGFFDDIDGLSTLGGDNQGNAFSLDGLSADLTNVTLNGQSFGQGRGNGGVGAGDLPPDMIRRVDIYRIPTAALEEGGSGGVVDLQLRNPVELTGSVNNVRARLSYMPDKENFNPSASLSNGRASENRKFGYLLNVSLSDMTNEYSSQDVSRWIAGDFGSRSAFYPAQVRNNAISDNQTKLFAGLTLGFRPHPSLDMSSQLFYSQKLREIETHGLQHRFEKQRVINALAFDDRIVSELESSDPSRRNLRIVGSAREDLVESLFLGADFNWRKSRWRVNGALGYGVNDNENDSPSQSATFEANNAFGYSANSDGSLAMNYPDGFPLLEDFSISRINLSDRSTEDGNGFGSLDVSRSLGDGFIRRVRFGGKMREATRERRSSKANEKLDKGLTLSDFFSGQFRQTQWDEHKWPISDTAQVSALVEESEIAWQETLLNIYDMERQTNAAYLQADFRAGAGDNRDVVGNFGARFVDTETRIAGYQENGGILVPTRTKTQYTDFLPSVSMRKRVAERTVLSLGAARVMTHPAFNDLAPGIRINYAEKTARSGNPELEPFRANQYMAELTWVPARGRRLSGNISYRDVSSYFALGEESIEIDDDVFLVTRPVNGDDGYILSALVRLEQNLRRLNTRLRNMSLLVSYAYNKSGSDMDDPFTGEELPMPNTAEQVLRVDLVYQKEKFGGKLSYQWRGESLRAADSESGFSVWNQPTGSLNLNLGWTLNDFLQLSLDGRNLLSEDRVSTTDDSGQIWRITERDRSVSATLRAKW